jgi:hypothetical protein
MTHALGAFIVMEAFMQNAVDVDQGIAADLPTSRKRPLTTKSASNTVLLG